MHYSLIIWKGEGHGEVGGSDNRRNSECHTDSRSSQQKRGQRTLSNNGREPK